MIANEWIDIIGMGLIVAFILFKIIQYQITKIRDNLRR